MDIKIIDTNAELKRKIGEAIKEKIKRRIDKTIRESYSEIRDLLVVEIKNSLTYRSLISGKLRGELGLSDSSVLDLEANVEHLFTLEEYFYEGRSSPKATKDGIKYARGIEITIDPDMDFFSYTSSNGEWIPWLDWLLNAGNNILVSDYKIYEKVGKGRSGMAIMISSEGSDFKISSEFTGTPNNNFLTEVIINNKENIQEIFRKNAEKR